MMVPTIEVVDENITVFLKVCKVPTYLWTPSLEQNQPSQHEISSWRDISNLKAQPDSPTKLCPQKQQEIKILWDEQHDFEFDFFAAKCQQDVKHRVPSHYVFYQAHASSHSLLTARIDKINCFFMSRVASNWTGENFLTSWLVYLILAVSRKP